MKEEKLLRGALLAWGWLCLLLAALYLIFSLWAEVSPTLSFNPGSTGLGEWVGMGLLSLGMAQVLKHLSAKD